jgi:hypothetical protein
MSGFMSMYTIPVKGLRAYLAALHAWGDTRWARVVSYLGYVDTPLFLRDFDDNGRPTEEAMLAYFQDSEENRTPVWCMPPPPVDGVVAEADWRTGVGCGCLMLVTDTDQNVLHIALAPAVVPIGIHYDRIRVVVRT